MRFQRLRDRAEEGPVCMSGPMLTAMLDVIEAAEDADCHRRSHRERHDFGPCRECGSCRALRALDRLREADRACLCDRHHPNLPDHGGPCCGVAGGRCVNCQADTDG